MCGRRRCRPRSGRRSRFSRGARVGVEGRAVPARDDDRDERAPRAQGARTAFVTTAGFEHLLHLRRQTRSPVPALRPASGAALVPLERCHGVRGRIGPRRRRAARPRSRGRRGRDRHLPALLVPGPEPRASGRRGDTASSSARPRRRLMRGCTRVPRVRARLDGRGDAYLGPLVSRYLDGPRDLSPLVMTSAGGLVTIDEARPAALLLSGPAAGVVGAARVARLAGFENALSFDMGGTSTDVCAIVGGEAERSPEGDRRASHQAAERRRAHGRRRWWVDRLARRRRRRTCRARERRRRSGARLLRPWRHSPTVTDANLLLGRLPDQLAGGLELDRTAAERALDGLDPEA